MGFQKNLLDWFRVNARPLPWRKDYRPYEVWISEIMLQQTQMETALPYFGRWMKTLPTLESLAAADEKKVLKLWEGLGYYSRARNLHESAKRIVRERRGVFPDNYEAILSLKGVGRYTAGAIASIAFNQNRPIVDGNVLRVLSRMYAIKKPIDVETNKRMFWKLQESLIPPGRARDFNQALMELGALVCGAQNPSCGDCPIRRFCVAYKNQDMENYPVRRHKKKMVKVTASAVVFSKNSRFFIHRRPEGKIMGGLWEFPEWKEPKNKIGRLVEKEFSLKTAVLKPFGKIKRNYTHHLETLGVFKARLNGEAFLPKKDWPSAWVTKAEFKKYPFSSAHAKIAKLI